MLLPRLFGENLLDDWMDFEVPMMRDFDKVDRRLYGRRAANIMKTDVHDHDDSYEVDIDLPGFKKDDIKVSLENGYLTVATEKNLEKDKKNHKGKVLRQERYSGSMQRSFYVGDALTEEDVKAKYENGVLRIDLPKKEAKQLPANKTIAIEG